MLKMLKKRQAKSSAEANKANDNHVSVEISDQGDGRGSESETSTTADTEDDNNGGQHVRIQSNTTSGHCEFQESGGMGLARRLERRSIVRETDYTRAE